MKEKRKGLVFLKHLLYPRRCPACDGLLEPDERILCNACERQVKRTGDVVCVICGKSLGRVEDDICGDCRRGHAFTGGRALYRYEGRMKEAMYRFKYENRRCYADSFALEAKEQYGELLQAWGIECIVPIPMYKVKERKRGYNQAKVFAKALADQFDLPMEELLYRAQDTPPMKGLSPEVRRDNVKNAFHMKRSAVQFNRILLVDDIYTTGATMDAAAGALLRNGITSVYAMYVCIGEGNGLVRVDDNKCF